MKCFSYILLNLTILFKLIVNWDELYGNVCEENKGNLEILEAFPWKGSLYIIGQKGQNYRIDRFKWDFKSRSFSNNGVEIIGKWNWTTKMHITFPIDYPGKGRRIVAIELDQVDDMQQLIGYLIDLGDHSVLKSKEELNLNIYKDGNEPDPLNLVSLFNKFPDEELERHLLSISTFPSVIGNLPQRLFAYYKETPTKRKQKDCIDCYRVKRYVFIARNITYGDNKLAEINWHIDNTTDLKCEDLNGLIINASFALTDYFALPGNPLLYFDWIEFFGTQFNVFRVSVDETNGLKDMEIIKTDLIGTIFGCQQSSTSHDSSSTTTESNTNEPETEESPPLGEQSTEGSEKSFESSSPTSDKPVKEPKKGGFVILIIIIIVILVFVIIGVIVWLLLRNQSTPPPSGSQPPQPQQPPTGPPPPAPTAPTSGPEVTPESTPPTADISEATITPTPEETMTIRSDLGD